MGGICSSVNDSGPRSKGEQLITLEDFTEEEKKYADQLMRLSSQSAHLLTPKGEESQRPMSARNANAINPIIAKQFVDTAKSIRSKQHALLMQIQTVGELFDMSSNSLQQNLQRLEASPKSELKKEEARKNDEFCKAIRKSIKDV